MTTSHLITTPSHQHIDKRTDKRKYISRYSVTVMF